MKQEIAIKWVEALRSGKYKQGYSQLYNKGNNSYCCLGVLQGPILNLGIRNNRECLSTKAMSISLISNKLGYNSKNSKHSSLAEKNDDLQSFSEIADYIEQNWQDL